MVKCAAMLTRKRAAAEAPPRLAGAERAALAVVAAGAVAIPLIVGRGDDAQVALADPQVSRRHAVVRAVDGALEIEDSGSANGTFVNGSRLNGPQRLRTGDEIAIGPVVLEPHIDREPVAATVASAA
jgi:pSer/pThr/pTyr-binding forkhead associated (FHA) protein